MLPLLASSTKLTIENNNNNKDDHKPIAQKNNTDKNNSDSNATTSTLFYGSGPASVVFVAPPLSPPSLSARLDQRLDAISEFLANRLLPQSFRPDVQKPSILAPTLYPEHCAENATLLNQAFRPGLDYSNPNGDSPSTTVDERQCRICLLPIAENCGKTPPKRRVVAPCRCAGSVQYVHVACLSHWIDVSTRKADTVSPHCELCGFRYCRKPWIDPSRLHFPYVDWCDRILNLLFLFLVVVMVLCGWAAVHYLCMTKRRPLIRASRNTNTRRYLTDNDVTVIIASILFFAAFFIALFTQCRAEVTVWQIVGRLWAINRNWRIRDYDPRLDDAPPPAAIVEDGGAAPSKSVANDTVAVEFVAEEC